MYDINNIMSNQESLGGLDLNDIEVQVEQVKQEKEVNICKIFANVHGREISESSLLSSMTNHIRVIMPNETSYTAELIEWNKNLHNKLKEYVESQNNTRMYTRNFVMGASRGEYFLDFKISSTKSYSSIDSLELLYSLNDTTDGFVEFDRERQHELEESARHTLRGRYTRLYMEKSLSAYNEGVDFLDQVSNVIELQNTTITLDSEEIIKMSDILVYILGTDNTRTLQYLINIYMTWIGEKINSSLPQDDMVMLSRIRTYSNEVIERIDNIIKAIKGDKIAPLIEKKLKNNLVVMLVELKSSYSATYEWIITAYEGHQGNQEIDGGLWHLQNFEPGKDNMNIKDREYTWTLGDPKVGFFLISLYLDGVKCFPTIPEGGNLTPNQHHNIKYYYDTLDPYFDKISEEDDGLKEFKKNFWAKFKESIGLGNITLAEVTLFQLIISDYSVIYDGACRRCIDSSLSGKKRPTLRTFTGPNPKTGPKTGGNHHQLGYKLINKNIHKNRISKRNKKNKPKRKSMNIRCNKKNSKKYTKKNRKHKNHKKYTKKNRKHKNNKNHKNHTKKNRKH